MSKDSYDIKAAPNNIGRFAMIEVGEQSLVGNVIDLVHGTDRPKRIRIQHGDPALHGSVVQPHEYKFKWWCDEEED